MVSVCHTGNVFNKEPSDVCAWHAPYGIIIIDENWCAPRVEMEDKGHTPNKCFFPEISSL
jgi:hypothetical protein